MSDNDIERILELCGHVAEEPVSVATLRTFAAKAYDLGKADNLGRIKWLEVENSNNLDLLRAERELVAQIWEASGAEQGRSLVEQIAALRVDAKRYQLLRRGQHWSIINGIGDTLRAESLDDAIDAARKETK